MPPLVAASVILLFGVWFGYPAVVGGLAALVRGRKRVPSRAEVPTVTVILATRDAPDAVRARIRNALDTNYPAEAIERVVVAVDAQAKPLPNDAFAEFGAKVLVVTGDQPGGKAAGLNAALRAVQSEVVVFTDTHQRFDRMTIPYLVAGLDDARVGAVSGRFDLGRSGTPVLRAYWQLERWLRRCEAELHSCVGVTGAVYAMRRSLWKPLPSGLILDDVYLPMRLALDGHRIGFADDAHAVETRDMRSEHEYARKVRTLTGNIQLCAWLPAILVPVRNPIWLQFVCHKLLRLLTPYWVAIIGLWLMWSAAVLIRPYAIPATIALTVVALWLWRSSSSIGRLCRRIFADGWQLQVAVVLAGINGARGRWEVWHK